MENIKIIKLRNKLTQEIVYTCLHWPEKTIDGVTFLSVSQFDPATDHKTRLVNYMKKESLEKVK